MIMDAKEPESVTNTNEPVAFTKEQLFSCKRFSDRRDVLSAVLEEGKTYTIEQAQSEIDKYMKGRVK